MHQQEEYPLLLATEVRQSAKELVCRKSCFCAGKFRRILS
jgi:hypothetical protein